MTRAGILVGEGATEAAIAEYEDLVQQQPGNPELHLSLGHALKTQGRREDAEGAYREAARQRVNFGDAYWSLANLKTYRFDDQQIAIMREQVDARRVPLVDRYHLCFALGKALEDRREYAESFEYYGRGNALKKAEYNYRPEVLERTVGRQIELCTREFFEQRQGWGCQDSAPIFIVGLPRAGSTLLEQILASHSQVEGTMELADIPRLVSSLDLHASGARYPDVLALPSADNYRGFGEGYIRDTRHYRVGNKPYFIDKMPNNFRHVGLIHLMLPNAKIIDARREPAGLLLQQLQAAVRERTAFHLQPERHRTLLPDVRAADGTLGLSAAGRVLRVQHEDVLDDLEGSVRRMLAYCGLDFEPACVEFHKNERRVHTASSEQVRRPINREGVDQWRHYEPWLGELRAALDDAAAG